MTTTSESRKNRRQNWILGIMGIVVTLFLGLNKFKGGNYVNEGNQINNPQAPVNINNFNKDVLSKEERSQVIKLRENLEELFLELKSEKTQNENRALRDLNSNEILKIGKISNSLDKIAFYQKLNDPEILNKHSEISVFIKINTNLMSKNR